MAPHIISLADPRDATHTSTHTHMATSILLAAISSFIDIYRNMFQIMTFSKTFGPFILTAFINHTQTLFIDYRYILQTPKEKICIDAKS